jgi:hypothetical protein
MSEYITFRKFITTGFIIAIYILGALAVTVVSILVMLSGGSSSTLTGMALTNGTAIIIGILLLIFGNLFWRVVCEYMVVQFRIYDELVMLNRKTGVPTPTSSPMPPPAQTGPVCPSCGSPLRYIQQYQRWYCDKEQKYV